MATASVGTAKVTADGLGGLAHALWVGLRALARALVVTLDAIGGATLAAPRMIGRGSLALDALPEGPLRVAIRKPGFAPITRRIDVADFTVDGKRLRHSVQLTLRAPATKAHGGAPATADEASATTAPTAPTSPPAPADALPPGSIPLAPARSNGPGRTGLFSARDPSALPAAP